LNFYYTKHLIYHLSVEYPAKTIKQVSPKVTISPFCLIPIQRLLIMSCQLKIFSETTNSIITFNQKYPPLPFGAAKIIDISDDVDYEKSLTLIFSVDASYIIKRYRTTCNFHSALQCTTGSAGGSFNSIQFSLFV